MLTSGWTHSITVLVLLAARPASPRRARSYDDGDPFDADATRAQFSRHNYHRRVQDQGDDSPQYDGGAAPLSAAGAARRDYRSFPWSDDNPRSRIYPPPLAVDGDATGGLGYQFLRRRGGGGHRRHLPDDAYRPPPPRWADQGDDQDDADWRGPPRPRLADGRDHAIRWDRRQGADPTEERDRPGGAKPGRRPEDTPRAESTLEGRQEPRQEPRQGARREDARQDARQDRKEPRQDSRQDTRQDPQLDAAQAVASEGQPDGRTAQDDVQDATPNPKPLIVRVWLSIDQRSGPVLLQQVSPPPPPFQPGAVHLLPGGGHRRPRPAPKAPPPPGDLRGADKTAASKHIVINNYYNHFPLDGATQDGGETTPYEQTTPDTSVTEQGLGNEEPQTSASESSADLTVPSLADATVTTAMPSQTDSVEPLPASDLETYLGSDLRDADDAKPPAHAGHLSKPVLTERLAERSADRTVLKAASAVRPHGHAGDRTKKRRPSPGPSARDGDGGGASSKSSGGASGAGTSPGNEAGSGSGATRTKAHASGSPSKRCFSIVTENKVKRYKETPC